MRVGLFSCKPYDKEYFTARNNHFGYELEFLECALTPETVSLAMCFDAVSVFKNDKLDHFVLDQLKKCEVNHVALRCKGIANVDLGYAKQIGIGVSRVPYYSSASVAEHAIALMLALNRKLLKSYTRAVDNYFELQGLLGFNLKSKTVGIIGTGAIGSALIDILLGFGCKVLCYDNSPSEKLSKKAIKYVALDHLFREADIISLHCPLSPKSRHIVDHQAIQKMKSGVMLINTSLGDLIDTQALIAGLKSKKIGFVGIDIYELESQTYQNGKLADVIETEFYNRLATFPNVLITSHQGFFTEESLAKIVDTTLLNLQYFFAGKVCQETFL